jgi:transposase
VKSRYPGCKVKLIYEAGFSGFGLHDFLEESGIGCVVTPPHLVTQEKNSKVKTDKIDARRLAKNLENGDYVACSVPDKELREDRQLSRTLSQIQRKLTSTKNQIRRLLEFHGLDSKFTPGKWTEASYKQLERDLDALGLSRPLRFTLELLLALMKQLESHKKALLAQIKVVSQKQRYQGTVGLLMSVPGIGFLTAIRLQLEWGDIKRFTSKKRFSSYLGLTPTEYSSGETQRKGHITGQGNKLVRSWLIESAWFGIRKDPALQEKYQAVWVSSGSKKKAIVAVARKMAIRIRTLLLNQEPYCLGVVQ